MSEGLKMKYFILKPEGNSNHAKASRAAMMVYADEMEEENPNFAKEVKDWVLSESTQEEINVYDNRLVDRILENLCTLNKKFLHNHPTMEASLRINEVVGLNHVIVDKEDWEKAKQIISDLSLWASQG